LARLMDIADAMTNAVASGIAKTNQKWNEKRL
jgi:hypothetical protein